MSTLAEAAHEDCLVWVLSIFGILLNIFDQSEHLRRYSFMPKALTFSQGTFMSILDTFDRC